MPKTSLKKENTMAISGISGNIPSIGTQPTPAVEPAKTNQVDLSTAKSTSTPPKHDSVKLTGTALAKSLKLAGQTPAQIAQKMGVPIATVDSYLSIKAPVTPPPPAPKAAAAPQTATTPQAASASAVKTATKA
jgi:hypothetical protein